MAVVWFKRDTRLRWREELSPPPTSPPPGGEVSLNDSLSIVNRDKRRVSQARITAEFLASRNVVTFVEKLMTWGYAAVESDVSRFLWISNRIEQSNFVRDCSAIQFSNRGLENRNGCSRNFRGVKNKHDSVESRYFVLSILLLFLSVSELNVN